MFIWYIGKTFFSIQTLWSMNDILMPFHIQAFRNRNKVRSGMAASPHLHYSCVLYHTSQRITLFLWQHFSNFALALLFFYPNFRGPFLHSRSSQFEKFDSLILYLKKPLISRLKCLGRLYILLSSSFFLS